MGNVKKRNKTNSEIWLTVICIVLVAVVVLSILTAALTNAGFFLRISEAAATENFEISGAMMSYFFNEELRSWVSNNATYIQYASLYPSYFGDYSVSFTTDLDQQTCKLISDSERTDDYTTWYDYFMGLTVESVTRYLEYAEGAKKAGVELDEDDEKEIKESINSLKADIKSLGYSLDEVYGTGISWSDIKKCFELKELAIKYAEIKIEELKGELKGDDADVLKYPEDHRSDYYSVKYLAYTIQVKESNYNNDEEFESAKLEAKAAADLIAKADTPEGFFEEILKYEESSKAKAEETATESATTASSTTSSTTAEETTKTWEDYTKETYEGTGTSDLDKWLFEDGRSEEDYTVIEETATETVTTSTTTSASKEATTEESATTSEETTTSSEETTTSSSNTKEICKYSAYKIVKPNGKNENNTFNIGYVITNDKAVAERIMKDFEEGSSRTAEILKKLGEAEADKLDDDSEISIDVAEQENAMPEYFENFSSDLDKWLNSDTLKSGDNTGIVEIKPDDDDEETQYAIVHFDDYGKKVWYTNAFDAVMEERFENWFEELKKEMPVKENTKTLSKMSVSTYVQYIAYQAQNSYSSSTSSSTK